MINNTQYMVKQQKKCISAGMDQGFHNYLLYSNILNRVIDIKVFPQGEGPVNTLGTVHSSSI